MEAASARWAGINLPLDCPTVTLGTLNQGSSSRQVLGSQVAMNGFFTAATLSHRIAAFCARKPFIYNLPTLFSLKLRLLDIHPSLWVQP